MENSITQKISVGKRQTFITRTSRYQNDAMETQTQSSESSRTSGYESITNGSFSNGHYQETTQSTSPVEGQGTNLLQSTRLEKLASHVSTQSFSITFHS